MLPRGCPTKRLLSLLLGIAAVAALVACSGDSESDSSPTRTGTDEEQIQSLIREFSAKTIALDADGSFALLCTSMREKSDLKQIRQNMEGFKNIGAAAPQVSNLQFTSVTSSGDGGEAIYTYTQRFRGETTTIREGVKVAKEKGDWCIKEQLAVTQ